MTASTETQLFGEMTRFLHSVAQSATAELDSFGLTAAQFQMLVQIRSRPGIAQWELADAFGVTKGNVSQLIKKIEGAGLVERVRNQGTDELALTVSGQALLDRVVPAHHAFMQRTFGALSADERDLLLDLIRRLAPR